MRTVLLYRLCTSKLTLPPPPATPAPAAARVSPGPKYCKYVCSSSGGWCRYCSCRWDDYDCWRRCYCTASVDAAAVAAAAAPPRYYACWRRLLMLLLRLLLLRLLLLQRRCCCRCTAHQTTFLPFLNVLLGAQWSLIMMAAVWNTFRPLCMYNTRWSWDFYPRYYFIKQCVPFGL